MKTDELNKLRNKNRKSPSLNRNKFRKSKLLIIRTSQQNKMLFFVILMTIASFTVLCGMLLLNYFGLIWFSERYRPFSETIVNIFITGTFAELVGVIGVISKQLWSQN